MLKEFEFIIFRKQNIKYQYFRKLFLYSFQINLVQYILQVVPIFASNIDYNILFKKIKKWRVCQLF